MGSRARLMPLALAGFASLSLVGCGDPPWVGTFTVSADWDLRGPFTDGRTMGDAVTEIVLGKIVDTTPCPSFLEDDLFELLVSFDGGTIKTMIDTEGPAELRPTGSVTQFLSGALASVRTTSRLVLDEATFADLEGEETITALEYDLPGGVQPLPPGNLFDQAGAEMVAEWEGDESGETTMAIEPHAVPLQYGALLAEILLHLLDQAGLDGLRTGVLAALDCPTLVDQLLDGQPGFTVTVGEWSHTIPASDFQSACAAAQSAMGGRVLGLFSTGTRVVVGGTMKWTEKEPVTLTSPKGFTGILDVAPESVAPEISVTFTATKRKGG